MAQTFKKLTINGGGVNDTFISPQIAAEFSTSKAYAVGDYCTYQGQVYRFTAAKSAGAWDSTKVTAVNIADDVQGKAPIASPTFTGTPQVPTATAGTNTTQIASTAFVTGAVSTEAAAREAADADLRSASVLYEVGTNILNAYDTDIMLVDKYVVATTGRVSNNTDWLSYLIPIKGGEVISFRSSSNTHISFYSQNTPNFNSLASNTYLNGYISGISPSSNLTGYTVPSSAKYMCISIPSTRQGTIQVSYTETSVPYEPYKKGIYYDLILDPPEIETNNYVTYNIYVDGTGDFDNLRTCLNSIPTETSADFDKNTFYIINLHEGTHDIIGMWDSESSLPTSGLFFRPNTKIRGVGDKHNVIVQGLRTTTSTTWSLFNIRNYADVENLTLKSKNARYTIHDDWQTAIDVESYRHFKDVIFIGENCQYGSVYGSGLKGNSNWEFINCEFDASKAAANGTAGNALSLHNNNNVTIPSFVTFRNCRLLNGSDSYKTLRFLSMTTGSENGTVYVTLEGNKVDGIRLSENNATQYGAGCSFYVNGFGNVNTLGVSVVSSDGVDYTGRVDLI